MNGFEWLESLSQEMKGQVANGAAPEKVRLTVRDFMLKFDYYRRAPRINRRILNKLDELKLRTVPSFDRVWFDDTISVELDLEDGDSGDGPDPTIRIGILEAANRPPVSVKPDDRLSAAFTIMRISDFSQLPVMQTERVVKGVVSWKSIAARVLLGREREPVRQCMDPPQIIDIATPLLDAVDVIQRHDYVLVRDETNKITGIVTASDITQQFMQLSTPFLLVGEIEGRLRRLIHGKFTLEQLKSASAKSGNSKPIEGPADLTFGGYAGLLQKEEHWNRLGLDIDRKEFLKRLESVREIRNEVMHFDPEGLDSEQKKNLEEFAKFFRYLESIGAV